MATVYFAKFNINSNINKIHRKQVKIEDILIKMFNDINDDIIYNYGEEPNTYEKDGEIITYFGKQYFYSFSELIKDETMKSIAGRLVRVDKIKDTIFNKETKLIEERNVDNHAEYITFYWEVLNETIAFTTKHTFKYNQFFIGLKGILDSILNEYTAEFVLDKNNFEIRENLSKFYKIRKIKTISVTANANDGEIKSFDEKYKKLLEENTEANIEKRKEEFSVSKKNEEGINRNSNIVERILYGVEKRYTDIIIEGENEDGTDFKYDPRSSNPFTVIIPEGVKNSVNEFKDEIKKKFYEVFMNRKMKEKK